MNFFKISDEDFLNKNKIKVFDGIAGSAKSSNVDKIFKAYDLEYLRCTSTNKLKRDAEARYGGHNDTIAGALFTTEDGLFFQNQKETELTNVVIDEVLQTDSRVFKWCDNHVGINNIIICTDTEQLLSPGCGEYMLERFREFVKQDDVIYVKLDKTYRPRNYETELYFNKCYKAVSNNLFAEDKGRFKIINFEDMPYNHNDVYICHTNDIEEYLYNEFDIYNDYSADLIQKGCISRKNIKTESKYPILPQNKVSSKIHSYLQPSNVASATRYQGSEVTEMQRLYFLVEPYSKVDNREWYTVVSRCYNINSLTIVVCRLPHVANMKKYFNKPIKDYKTFALTDENAELDELIKDNKNKSIEVDLSVFDKIRELINKEKEFAYESDYFFYKGKRIIPKDGSRTLEDEEKKKNAKKPKIYSLLAKEPRLELAPIELELFYKKIDYIYINNKYFFDFNYQWHGEIQSPVLYADKMERKENLEYSLDLYSSYPHILANSKLPVGRFFTEEEENSDLVIKWYLIVCEEYPIGSIITQELKDEIEKTAFHSCPMFYYIGYTEAQHGSKMGAYLLEQAFKNEETKQDIKGMHYGLLERKYIEAEVGEYIGYGCDEVDHYIRNTNNRTQLLMYAIKSEQLRLMLYLKRLLYGDNRDIKGFINADCVCFDYKGDIENLGMRLSDELKPYKFRIYKGTGKDKELVYKNYADLLSKKDYVKQLARERKRAQRVREKECKNVN